MAQALTNNLWILVRGEQERRAAMAQIIKAECRRELGTFEYRLKMLLNNIQPDQGLTLPGSKHEIKVLVFRASLKPFLALVSPVLD